MMPSQTFYVKESRERKDQINKQFSRTQTMNKKLSNFSWLGIRRNLKETSKIVWYKFNPEKGLTCYAAKSHFGSILQY